MTAPKTHELDRRLCEASTGIGDFSACYIPMFQNSCELEESLNAALDQLEALLGEPNGRLVRWKTAKFLLDHGRPR